MNLFFQQLLDHHSKIQVLPCIENKKNPVTGKKKPMGFDQVQFY